MGAYKGQADASVGRTGWLKEAVRTSSSARGMGKRHGSSRHTVCAQHACAGGSCSAPVDGVGGWPYLEAALRVPYLVAHHHHDQQVEAVHQEVADRRALGGGRILQAREACSIKRHQPITGPLGCCLTGKPRGGQQVHVAAFGATQH